MTANPPTCRKCGSPVTPGMKFCESCGAKIEALPACPQCGAALVSNVKFCETCGAPVGLAAVPVKATPAETAPAVAPVAAPLPPVPETPPVQEVKPPAAVPVKVEEKTIPVPEEKPAPPKLPVKAEEKIVPVPEEKPAPAPAQVKVPPKTEKARDVPKEAGVKKPIPQQTMVIAGIIVLALLGAAVYFVVLPMINGPAMTSQNQQVPTVTTSPVSSSVTPATPAETSQDATVSFTPGPTQVPPSNRVIILDTERDPISSMISVTFRGGEGQYGVSEILVKLTRSDGTVVTKTFKPDVVGSGVTLEGTTKTDRIEVTTYFYTGEKYKIIDQIFEYKKRGG